MVSMRLPPDAPSDLKERLYDEYRIEIPVWKTGTIRASFQGYNDESDLDALADALRALLATRVEA
jgi:selenocysteine lyase/cysteine desulfurase